VGAGRDRRAVITGQSGREAPGRPAAIDAAVFEDMKARHRAVCVKFHVLAEQRLEEPGDAAVEVAESAKQDRIGPSRRTNANVVLRRGVEIGRSAPRVKAAV
jgi:hypothetical protein